LLLRRKKSAFHQKSSRKLQQILVMCKLVAVFFCVLFFSLSTYSQRAPLILKDTLTPIKIKNIPANYYTQHLSVFCKKEVQIQKTTGLNLFFRLGNKEYVDYLERKPNAVKRD